MTTAGPTASAVRDSHLRRNVFRVPALVRHVVPRRDVPPVGHGWLGHGYVAQRTDEVGNDGGARAGPGAVEDEVDVDGGAGDEASSLVHDLSYGGVCRSAVSIVEFTESTEETVTAEGTGFHVDVRLS